MALCAHSQKKKRFELLFLAVERSSEYSWRQTKLPLSIAIIKWILGFCDILVYRCGQGRTKKQTNIKIKKKHKMFGLQVQRSVLVFPDNHRQFIKFFASHNSFSGIVHCVCCCVMLWLGGWSSLWPEQTASSQPCQETEAETELTRGCRRLPVSTGIL